MLSLERLLAENALSYKRLEVPLAKQGLVFIGGPNGFGKSTPWDILTMVFHGETSKGVKGNSLLCRYNPQDFFTQLSFSQNEHEYLVELFRAHTQLGTGINFTEDGVKINEKTGRSELRDTQRLVAEKSGLSVQEWYGTVYLSQNYTHTLIEGTPTQKREYLVKLYGLERINWLINEISTREVQVSSASDLSAYDTILADIQSELDALPEADPLALEITELSEQHKTIKAQADAKRIEVAEQEALRRLVEKHAAKTAELTKSPYADLPLDQAKSRLAAKKKLISSLSWIIKSLPASQANTSETQAEPAMTEEQLQSIESEIELHKSLLADYQADIHSLRLIVKKEAMPAPELPWSDSLKAKLDLAKTEAAKFEIRLAIILDELSKLAKLEDVCFTCLRPVSPGDKSQWIADRELAKAGLAKQLSKHKGVAATLADVSDTWSEYNRARQTIDSLRTTLKREAKEYDPDKLLDSADALRAHRANLTYHEAILQSKAKLLESAIELKTELETLDVKLYDPNMFGQLQNALAALDQQVEQEQTSFAEKLAQQALIKRLKERQVQVTSEKQVAATKQNRRKILQTLHLSLKDLRALKLHDANKKLITALPEYMSVLFKNETVKVDVSEDETNCDLVFEKGGATIPLEGLSGGQGRKLGLAIIFAFAKLLKRHANILICDEPYANIDAEARSACYEILRDFMIPDEQGSIESIFVMSHDEDVVGRKYDQRWRVTYDGQYSTLHI